MLNLKTIYSMALPGLLASPHIFISKIRPTFGWWMKRTLWSALCSIFLHRWLLNYWLLRGIIFFQVNYLSFVIDDIRLYSDVGIKLYRFFLIFFTISILDIPTCLYSFYDETYNSFITFTMAGWHTLQQKILHSQLLGLSSYILIHQKQIYWAANRLLEV